MRFAPYEVWANTNDHLAKGACHGPRIGVRSRFLRPRIGVRSRFLGPRIGVGSRFLRVGTPNFEDLTAGVPLDDPASIRVWRPDPDLEFGDLTPSWSLET